MAFLFGLLHGFGLASGLTTAGMPKAELQPALLFFNVGVELGQLVFVFTALALARSFRVLEVRWPRWVAALPGYTVGGLVAADLGLPVGGVTGLAVVLGIVHGFLNGAVLRAGAGALGLLGIVSLLFVLVTLAAALVVSLEEAWARIAVRVAGSRIAAVGLLMLGWAAR